MTTNLSPGSISAVFAGQTGLKPILQILDVKKLQQQQGGQPDRYRVICSDGTHWMLGMLATQLNPLVVNGQIQNFSVVRVDDYMCNPIQAKKFVSDFICFVTIANFFHQGYDIAQVRSNATIIRAYWNAICH